MKSTEVAAFLKNQVAPLPDTIYGPRYRAAATLTDGTFLPCVVFQSQQRRVSLALKRFAEASACFEREYRVVVESFVAGGSRLAAGHDRQELARLRGSDGRRKSTPSSQSDPGIRHA